MSDLEQRAQPLIEPMLHGETKILDRARQELLATWAFKTTAMLEFTHPQERAIQHEANEWLFRDHQPPPSVTIWIASYRGVNYNAFYRHDVIQPARSRVIGGVDEIQDDREERERDAPLPPPVAYGVTLGVRHLAFQLFGTTRPTLRIAHGGIAQHAFKRIWPFQAAFTWPPDVPIDDDDLPAVFEMFRNANVG
jgi:hypothetical protein